jgi:prepilin-type N-terminal cleavage/methylation domain-containing protein/prepilin-type processing-associated H-X9-DG protein
MKREGFTLTELLVVIAIIALLIAISVSIFTKWRLDAITVVCKSNIKQLSLDLIMYEDDNGTFPYACDINPRESPPGGYPGNPLYDKIGWWWFNHFIDYSRKNPNEKTVILCPSKKMNDIGLKTNVLCGNYGVNLSICKNPVGRTSQAEFVGTPLSISNILQPNRSLLIFDSGYSMISWWHVTDIPPAPLVGLENEVKAYVPGLKMKEERYLSLWSEQKYDAINGRHPNKEVNVGYVDGHVDRRKADDLYVKKTGNGYNNRYPLWSPIKNNND